MQTTIEEVKASVWALADELNKDLLQPLLEPEQQPKKAKNISLVRLPVKKERLGIRPSKFGYYIAPSQRSLAERMVPFLRDLTGKDCNGYYQPPNREPYWYVDDWELIRKAVYFFAEIPYPTDLKYSKQKSFIGFQEEFDKRLNISIQDSSENRRRRLEQATLQPTQLLVTIKVMTRNPDVVAEALFRAKGICESCKKPAPFLRKADSTPYLEVHHIERLADGGLDTLDNVLALCPNCHRREHYGS